MKLLKVIVLILLAFPAVGQTKGRNSNNSRDGILEKIKAINVQLAYYDSLSPFSGNENVYNEIDSVGDTIVSSLMVLLNDNRIVNYQIEKLLDDNSLFLSKSDDNRIYFISLDEKSDGSYKTSKTIIHYRLPSGKVAAELFSGEASEALATASYEHVFMLDSLSRTYFVIGKVLTCNTCIVTLAVTLTLDSNSIHAELAAQFDGRYGDLIKFEYDSLAEEFTYIHNAADNDDPLYGGNNPYPELQHQFHSKFKYTNGVFLEIEKCETWVKKE